MKVLTSEVETLKNDILKGNLGIQNVLQVVASYISMKLFIHFFNWQKIQQPDITESDILMLNSEYRAEFKRMKQLFEEFEKLAKEEDEDGELSDDVNLFRSQLTNLQASFRFVN